GILGAIYNNHQPIKDSSPSATNAEDRAHAAIEFFSLTSVDNKGLYSATPEDAVMFWSSIRQIEKALGGGTGVSGGLNDGKRKWLSIEDFALLSVLVGSSSKNDTPIRAGGSIKNAAISFHSPAG